MKHLASKMILLSIIQLVENKFIQFKTNSIPVCTNDQATISGEDNTIFNIYLKKG